MLQLYTAGVALAADVRLKDVADRMHRFTGAEVRAAAQEACLMAASRSGGAALLAMADLEEAVQCFVPSVTEQDVQAFKDWESANAH